VAASLKAHIPAPANARFALFARPWWLSYGSQRARGHAASAAPDGEWMRAKPERRDVTAASIKLTCVVRNVCGENSLWGRGLARNLKRERRSLAGTFTVHRLRSYNFPGCNCTAAQPKSMAVLLGREPMSEDPGEVFTWYSNAVIRDRNLYPALTISD
jgi:hypothetical protein